MVQALTADQRTRSERRREELVLAAFNQIAEHCFEGLRTRDVALRSARDRSIEKIFNQTRDAWQTAMRGLLRRGVREGNLRADLDSEAVATPVIAVLTSLTIPPLRDSPRGEGALRQLERWLGIAGR